MLALVALDDDAPPLPGDYEVWVGIGRFGRKAAATEGNVNLIVELDPGRLQGLVYNQLLLFGESSGMVSVCPLHMAE